MYLVVSKKVFSTVLVRGEDNKQKSDYSVNKALHRVKFQYQMIEKLAFIPLIASKRLRPYF